MAERLEFKILGPLEVVVGERRLALTSLSQRTLLALLLLRADQVVGIERLVDAQLLETPSAGRYRLHDLLRLYARELAVREHAEPVRAAMLSRALGFHVGTAWRCFALLRPGDRRLERADARWAGSGLDFADATSALDWLEAERPNLLAAVRQAAATAGLPSQLATQLTHALFAFFNVRSAWDDCVEANDIALEVARRAGDRAAQAQALNDLGFVYEYQGPYEQAIACYQESLAIDQELGDRHGQASTLTNLGNTYEAQGHYELAVTCSQRSLAIFEELGDRNGQGICLTNLGFVYERLGRYEQALDYHQESLAIDMELGDRHGQAIDHCNLGIIHRHQQRYDQALGHLRQSLSVFGDLGDGFGQATSLSNLGIVYQLLDRHGEAVDCHQRSLAIFEELGDRRGQAESLRELGAVLRALGREDEALANWRRALAICEELRIPEADEIRALLGGPPVEAPSG